MFIQPRAECLVDGRELLGGIHCRLCDAREFGAKWRQPRMAERAHKVMEGGHNFKCGCVEGDAWEFDDFLEKFCFWVILEGNRKWKTGAGIFGRNVG